MGCQAKIACLIVFCGCASIGSICCTVAAPDIPLLTRLLTECQTEQLTACRAYLHNDLQSLISRTYARKYGEDVIDLISGIDDSRNIQEKALAVGAPAVPENIGRKDRHDSIAKLCPNIKALAINVELLPHTIN
jgi:hypothetical protein